MQMRFSPKKAPTAFTGHSESLQAVVLLLAIMMTVILLVWSRKEGREKKKGRKNVKKIGAKKGTNSEWNRAYFVY